MILWNWEFFQANSSTGDLPIARVYSSKIIDELEI